MEKDNDLHGQNVSVFRSDSGAMVRYPLYVRQSRCSNGQLKDTKPCGICNKCEVNK